MLAFSRSRYFLSFLLILVVGCGEDAESSGDWKPTFDSTGEILDSKADSVNGRSGIAVDATKDDLVWEVRNAWSDSTSAEANEAGMAWPEFSGLDWEAKYALWVGSLKRIPSAKGWGRDTIEISTPFGKTIAGPNLECAEFAILTRVAFASWYGLPYFMEARWEGKRLYFGHFGTRFRDGSFWKNTKFAHYDDHRTLFKTVESDLSKWPKDPSLRRRSLPQNDVQDALGADTSMGDYLDELFLNKRVGHFLINNLAWFGSINLADDPNTYHLQPWAMLPGDVFVKRTSNRGTGHINVVIRSSQVGTTEIDGEEVPKLHAQVVYGNIPRDQPRWQSDAYVQTISTSEEYGGPRYSSFGGGLRRWRTAKEINGRWTNVVFDRYADVWINSNNKRAREKRIVDFEKILPRLSIEEKTSGYLELVSDSRDWLVDHPSSCSRRINREKAFTKLYDLFESEGWSKERVDREFREFSDYVLPELEYKKSKTCCWNSTSREMYELVMQMNIERVYDETTGSCEQIVAFKNRDDEGDGFEVFREYAASVGQQDAWVEWSADEFCDDQLEFSEAVEAEHKWTPLCDVVEAIEPAN